jgi:hypothetical protein
MRAHSTSSQATRAWHHLVVLVGPVQRGWQRWQSAVGRLYYRRVTQPVRLWLACGRPPEFRPQLPWWQPFVWRYLSLTGYVGIVRRPRSSSRSRQR